MLDYEGDEISSRRLCLSSYTLSGEKGTSCWECEVKGMELARRGRRLQLRTCQAEAMVEQCFHSPDASIEQAYC